mmetsp:Transcript_98326/g.261239  ORF Transcript_98326/g.261239 Transcript_98326/m.261239 type:complete len:414 (+) Transcript_98326:241-1482(+)
MPPSNGAGKCVESRPMRASKTGAARTDVRTFVRAIVPPTGHLSGRARGGPARVHARGSQNQPCSAPFGGWRGGLSSCGCGLRCRWGRWAAPAAVLAAGLDVLGAWACRHWPLVLAVIKVLHVPLRFLLLVRLRDGALAKRLAHAGEEALGLLVLLLLALLGLLQESAGLLVLGVQIHHSLAVGNALHVVLQAKLCLCPPVHRLHVLRLVLEHRVASLLRLCVILKLQVARGLVQLARGLQGLCLRLVVLVEVVNVVEDIDNLLVALEGHLVASGFEERGALLLAGSPKLQLLLLGQAVGVLGLLELGELHCQDDLVGLHALQAQLCFSSQRGLADGDDCLLALLHLRDGALEGVADLAVPRCELEDLGREARQRAAAVGGSLHGKRALGAVLWQVVAVSLRDLLLHHRLVLRE